MKVYEVKSTNIDVNDGIFCRVLFDTMDKAIKYCKLELEDKKPKNVTEDFNGTLKEFDGKSLNYTPCQDKPAIYYNSHYGNYRCVVFVETRQVY